MGGTLPTTYVRVDLSALRHNFEEVAGFLAGRARLMAVVKANAYGHGLVDVGRFFAGLGCAALGVASVAEGLELRQGGVATPITVFQPALGEELAAAAENRLTVTLTQEEHIDALAQRMAHVDYEIGVDVGLGRSGCWGDPAEFLRQAERRLGWPASGVWTHLGPGMVPARLPERPPDTWAAARTVGARLRYLEELREGLAGSGAMPLFHVTASNALCDTDGLLWDQVRVGTLLYGVHPIHVTQRPFRLHPALELRTHIVELRLVPRGTSVGYGGEFRTSCPARLATLPVGLSHGISLLPESTLSLPAAAKRSLALALGRLGGTFRPNLARVGGALAPLVGRPSLNECTVDVTDIPSVNIGDEVVVPARMTTLNPTIPRVYDDGSKG